MGRLGKKESDRGQKKRGILFGRRQKGRVEIDGQKQEDVRETYRAIGRVNARHLQGSQAWDVGYLGCVPDLEDWECPGTRSEFMDLVDNGQQKGHLMWCSLTPKRFHISPQWVVVTDYKKKVMYTEIPISSLGSLAYAEDDGKHILGVKAVQPVTMGGASLGRHTPTPSEAGHEHSVLYCCHTFECGNEEVVRQICAAVNDRFQHLLVEQEAREMQRQQQQTQAVKPIMLKRLSASATAAEPHRSAGKKDKKKKLSRQQLFPKSEQFPSPAHESVSEFEFTDLSGSNQDLPTDWSTSSIQQTSNPPDISPEREEILEEIGRHFSAITKDPSRRRAGLQARAPNVKRLSAVGVQGSASRRRKALIIPTVESMESMDDMVPPLKLNVVKKHAGNRITQQVEDATGIELEDAFDLLIPQGKPRRSVLDHDSFMQPGVVEPMDVSGNAPQPVSESISRSEQEESRDEAESSTEHSVLHTSLLLETMEEGEVETRIDGDESGAVLIQTHMSEKETAIVGEEGHAALIPASELGQNESMDHHEQTEPQAEGHCESLESGAPPPTPPPIDGSAPTEALPPTEAPPPCPSPSPPPELEKPERQPWPAHLIVGVDKEPWDPTHKEFLDRVVKEVGEIVYRQFREDWLQYQLCKMDVVGFAKKVKLAFRGSRVPLRAGARVLVDEDDRQDFDDVLAGKTVEPKKGSPGLAPPTAPVSMDTSRGPPAVKNKPPSFSPGPSPSTSHPGHPAGSGSLGNRLKMFEQPSSDSAPPPLMGASSRPPGKLGRFLQAQSDEDQSSNSASKPRPARGGLLSKIAMFEGGVLPTIEEEERPSPKSLRKQDDDDYGRDQEREWERRRGGRDAREKEPYGRQKEKDKRKEDSDNDDRRGRRRYRSPESKRGRHRKGEHSPEEKGRSSKHKDKRGRKRGEDSEEDRRSRKHRAHGKKDKDYSDDERKHKDRRLRDESDDDRKHKDRSRRDYSDDDDRRQKDRRKGERSDDERKQKDHRRRDDSEEEKHKDHHKRDEYDEDTKHHKRYDSDEDRRSRKKKDHSKRRDELSDSDKKSKRSNDRGKKEKKEDNKGKQLQKSPQQETEDSTGLFSILSAGSKLLNFNTKEEEEEEEKEKDAIGELAQLLSGQGRRLKDSDHSLGSSSKAKKPLASNMQMSHGAQGPKSQKASSVPQGATTLKEQHAAALLLQHQGYTTSTVPQQQHQVALDLHLQQQLLQQQQQQQLLQQQQQQQLLQQQQEQQLLQQQQQQQQAAALLQEQHLASLQQQQVASYLQQQHQLASAMQQAQVYQPPHGGIQQAGMMMQQPDYHVEQAQPYYQQSYQQVQSAQQAQPYQQVHPAQQAHPTQQAQAYQQYQSYPEQQLYMAQQTPMPPQYPPAAIQQGRVAMTTVTPASQHLPVRTASATATVTPPPQQVQAPPLPPAPNNLQLPVVTTVSSSTSAGATLMVPPQQTEIHPLPITSTDGEETQNPLTTPSPPMTSTSLAQNLTPGVTQEIAQPTDTTTPPSQTPPPQPLSQPDFDETAEDEVELTRFSEESDDEGSTMAQATEEDVDATAPLQPPPGETAPATTSITPPVEEQQTPVPPPPPTPPPVDYERQPTPPPIDYDKQPPPLPADYDKQPPLPPVDYERQANSGPAPPLPDNHAPPPPPPPPVVVMGDQSSTDAAPLPPPPPPPPIDIDNQAGSRVPPPPPPLTIGDPFARTTTESRKSSMSDVHEERDTFLEEIRQGKKLMPVKKLSEQDKKPSTTSLHEDFLAEIQTGKKLRKVSKEDINDRSGRLKRKGMDILTDSVFKHGGAQGKDISTHEGLLAELKSGKQLRKVSQEEFNVHAKHARSKMGVLELDEPDALQILRYTLEGRHGRDRNMDEYRDDQLKGEEHGHDKRHRKRMEVEGEEEVEGKKARRGRRHRHGRENVRDERHHHRKDSDEDQSEDRHSKKHHHKQRYSDDEETKPRRRHHRRRDSGEEGSTSGDRQHRRREEFGEVESKDRHKKGGSKDERRHRGYDHRRHRDEGDHRRYEDEDHRERHQDRGGHNSPDGHEDKRGQHRHRDHSREREYSDHERGRRDDDPDHDSGRGSPPSSSRMTETKKERPSASHIHGGAQATKREKIPAWKAALLKRREEKQIGSDPEKVIKLLEEEDPLDANDSIPAWKKAMLKKKQLKTKELEEDRARKQAMMEAKFEGVPEWKKEIMMKKQAQHEAAQAVELEREKEEQEKIDMVRQMPEWKRKLFLQKNPDFVFPD